MRSQLTFVLALALLIALPALVVCERTGDEKGYGPLHISALAALQDPEETPTPDAPVPTPAPPPPKRVAVSAAIVERGPASIPAVCLAINAGSGYPPAEAILDVLASRGVKTTFFLMGWWAEKNSDLVRRIQAEGQE